MKKHSGHVTYSPADLNRYLASPFASWMDRYYLENPGAVVPDEETEDQKLIAETGNQHERRILEELRGTAPTLVEILRGGDAIDRTKAAVATRAPVIYQGALADGEFSGFSDFILLNDDGNYQVWDTKLAASPKPYYAIQLCCYSEMFAETTGEPMPERFGIILGNDERVEFWVEDFIHYYRYIKDRLLEMQREFTGNLDDRPEPLPRADHGRWTSHADAFLDERDHLVRVAGISVAQIKKLHAAGIETLTQLSESSDRYVRKLNPNSLKKLADQARLQYETRNRRRLDPDASAVFEIIPQENDYEVAGLAALPADHSADVFFDMEGYPLIAGGLEYLFGATTIDSMGAFEFHDWWAHDREEEKLAFGGFVDWVHSRWRGNPGMHIYHYAAYELSALRRLSTRHDTRQEEVDDLLRHEVLVDLYQIVRQGLRIGEDSYSIKKVERLYRQERSTDVASGTESIVQYARWMESGESRVWNESPVLKDIRVYNKDDCDSTAELSVWLRKIASENGIAIGSIPSRSATPDEPKELPPEAARRLDVANKLRDRADTPTLAQRSEPTDRTPPIPNLDSPDSPHVIEPLLSEAEASQFLGISKMTLLRKRSAGLIGFFRVGIRVLYSKEKHLLPYLANCEVRRKI
ncbi:MAG: TM0106 family RecB-like putative nuclease [bacterium]|nr:TM0106 family RecB-like putative nuclease [bacterium]